MRGFTRFLAFIGAIVLVIFVICFLTAIGVRIARHRVASNTVLEINLEGKMVEDVPDDAVARAMLSDRNVVRDVVDALDRAGDDSRVVGAVAHIAGSGIGIAQVQEIREAIQRFRAKKKFAIAFSETFGEYGPGTGGYYLATAFDQIYLQPSGDIGLTGILFESPFIKGTLAKLGTQFHGDHRYEYKTALDLYTETGLTPAAREEDSKVVTSWYGQIVRGIAEGRHLGEDQVRALIDRGPLLGPQALDAKLVDGLSYRDEVMDQVKKKAGSGSQLLYFQRYLERAGRPHSKGKGVALIYGVGAVSRGKSGYDPVFGNAGMGSDTVSAAFPAAADDKDIKAILFRVDSPGGSYVASDAIWREVVKARKAGKPVIVSMGDLAGSGGYFVAMPADKIVAQPGTITASIGVLNGKLLTSGFWQKIGLSWDSVQAGANATMWTGTHDFTPAEWQIFESWLDRIYADFTTKVADGRHMPKDKVLQIAKGRIWTGEDAKGLGLVDELGGFDEALKLTKKAAGIPDSEDVNLRVFPEKKPFWQLLTGEKPPNSDHEAARQALVEVMNLVQPVAQKLQILGAGKSPEVLEMRPLPQP